MKTDYTEYHVTMQERCMFLSQGILLCVLVNWLFYRSILALLVMVPVPYLWLRFCVKERNKKRKKELNYQFRDALHMMSVSLRAGYSIENSLHEAEKDMRRMNQKGSEMIRELSYINHQIKVSIPVEELLIDLGERSGQEDIQNFASVFAIARRTGGDLVEIISDCADKIGEKIEVDKSIEISVAAKKFEQNIMSLMPVCIMMYMQLTSPGYFDKLYGTLFGVIFMSICLMVYLFACYFGHMLVRIEV